MSTWSLRSVRLHLVAAAFLAAVAYGSTLPAPAVAPHPLVTATEALYQRNLPRSCDELLKLASMAPGLTDDDLVRLQFVTALRALDDANELAARRALSSRAKRESHPHRIRACESRRCRRRRGA